MKAMLPQHPLLGRFLRFALVGLVVTLAYGLITWFAIRVAGVAPVQASALACAAVMLLSYVGQKYFTFRSGAAHRVELPRFVATVLLAFAGSMGSMQLVLRLGLAPEFGILAAAMVIPLGSFAVMYLWVFAAARAGTPDHR